MNIKIREANLDDISLLIKWRMRVLNEVFPEKGSNLDDELKKENLHYYKESILNHQHIACFAYIDDKTVGCGGMCIYKEMPSPDNVTGICAYLMNIYTCPKKRGQGVASEIVKWLIEKAKSYKITKIYLETSNKGRSLYEHLGFIDMSDMMKFPTI